MQFNATDWFNETNLYLNISTTDLGYTYDEMSWGAVALTYGVALLVIFVCIIACRKIKENTKRNKRKRKRKNSAGWSKLSDFNEIRSDFRSFQSIQSYIHSQSISFEIVSSIIFLIITIFINTYTNSSTFWHYRSKNATFDSSYKSAVLGADGVVLLSLFEMWLTFVFIIMCLYDYAFKNYVRVVYHTISMLPNISSLIYFSFLNTNRIKMLIKAIWRKSGNTILSKLVRMILWIPAMMLIIFVGIWVFYIKIKQISYIYDKDVELLGWSEFIVVVGIARQFATLVTANEGKLCWNFPKITLHPSKVKELQNDPNWNGNYNVDEVLCKEMVQRYGIFGFCWLCYTFGNIDNVKKLYLENYDEQQLEMMSIHGDQYELMDD